MIAFGESQEYQQYTRGRKEYHMVLRTRVFLFIVASLYANIFSYSIALPAEKGKIYGVKIYSYPKDYTPLFEQWKRMHINTVFASEELLADSSFRDRARYHGIATFLIAPIFFNPDLLHKNPSLYALTEKGKPAIDDWVEFVCPSREEYRKERIEYVVDRVKKYQPDGLSIDFIRFFVFWEMVYPDQTIRSMHNTCFCPTCLKKFQHAMHVAIPRQLKSIPEKAAWIQKHAIKRFMKWKCGVISSMVKEIIQEVRKVKPDILVNLHAVPWRARDYDGAIQKVVGQDFSILSSLVDYISPMCYSHMVRQSPAWIHSVVQDIGCQSVRPILPSIQVDTAYITAPFSVDEFQECCREALKPPSQGIVFWSWDAIEKNPEKMKIIEEILR